MKLAILSDIHANLEALRATLDDCAARGADRILCLGDIVGYNTDPNECVALLRARDALCIAGNHDRAATGQRSTTSFPHTGARAIAWTRKRLTPQSRDVLAALPARAVFADLVLVHGALHVDTDSDMVRLDTDERRRASFAALAAHPSGARICAFGHTHQAGIYEWRGAIRRIEGDAAQLHADAYYLVNPGTVGQPRESDRRASYCFYDTAQRRLALHRVGYDFAAAFAKTRRAGLAPPFSFLPASMRRTLIRGVRVVGLEGVAKRVLG